MQPRPIAWIALGATAIAVGAVTAAMAPGDNARAWELAAKLESADNDSMDQILWELYRLGEPAAPALPVLLDWMERDDIPQRWQSVAAIGGIGPAAEPAVPPLIRALPTDGIGWRAPEALAGVGPAAIPALRAALDDESTRAGALRHENLEVHGAAAGALYRSTGDLRPAMDALADCLLGPEDRFRSTCGRTLLRIGSAAAPVFPQVIAAFAQEDDPDAWFVLFDILLTAPEHAGGAIATLERAREDGSFFARIRADQALRVVRAE